MKRACWILGDQLSLKNSALLSLDKHSDIVIMIESLAHARELRHHRAKLLFCFSAMRHFRDELIENGYTVIYYTLEENLRFEAALKNTIKQQQIEQLFVMHPHEHATLTLVNTLSRQLGIEVSICKNVMFLTDIDAFVKKYKGKKHLVMEHFYREMRKKHGVLMNGNQPIGGEWNFDKENRRTASSFKAKKIKIPLMWKPDKDEIDKEVLHLVENFFPDNMGSLDSFFLPTSRKHAEFFFEDFISNRLSLFGDYEDTMLEGEVVLFHSAISPLINVGLLDPLQCIAKAIESFEHQRAPINAVEGFVRQIIGWREFIYGCYWLKMSDGDYHEENFFNHTLPLPDFYWTAETKLNCVSKVVQKVLQHGYSHHIERLMVLGNFALLAGISPKQLNQWFWEMYLDAYDWVVTPNVIGMSQYADGGFVATKPYCSGSGYIDKMSDYCDSCNYDKKIKTGEKACPFNYLYWNFLIKHESLLKPNTRMGMMYNTLEKKSTAEKKAIADSSEAFIKSLQPNSYY